MVDVKIVKIKDVKTPSYAREGDAGLDLYSAEEYLLKPGARVAVSTGVKMAIPIGYEGQIRPKSGLSIKHGISVVNTPGTIDAGYRGEIMVLCINHSNKAFKIEKNSKIAQMVFNQIHFAKLEEVEELDETERGEGGLGSTGLD